MSGPQPEILPFFACARPDIAFLSPSQNGSKATGYFRTMPLRNLVGFST